MKDTTVTPKRARRSVQSVDRALDLIEALVAAEGEVAITALATRTGLHVSTVHRLLATLLRRGYVRQNPETSRYYAGAKLATLSEGRSRFGELRLRARPLLRSLTEATRETANLVVLDDLQAVLYCCERLVAEPGVAGFQLEFRRVRRRHHRLSVDG